MTTNAYQVGLDLEVRAPTSCETRAQAMKRLASTRIAASASAARCSALPCPYWCAGSAGRPATPTREERQQRGDEVGPRVERLRDQSEAAARQAGAQLERDQRQGGDHGDEGCAPLRGHVEEFFTEVDKNRRMRIAALIVAALALTGAAPSQSGLCMSPGGRSTAVWSPSGEALALSLSVGACPSWQLTIVDGDGVRTLSSPSRAPQTASWSPDELSVVAGGSSFADDIVVYDAGDGSRVTAVGHGRNPAWSPDGDTIAFTADDGTIHLVTPEGTDNQPLATGDRAAWAPDSTQLAYIRGANVFVADSDGANERSIGSGETVRWSPTGGAVALLRQGQAILIPLDGSPSRTLGSGQVVGWSSDGGHVALLTPAGVLRTVDVATGATHRAGEDADAAAVPDSWDSAATVLRILEGTEVYVADINGVRPKRAIPIRCGALLGCYAGTDGADRIVGRSTRDVVYAGAGDDRVLTRGGNDRVEGSYGRDYVDAGAGNDVVFAHGNDDVILGGPGRDSLIAGNGEDRVDGGRGKDWITVSGDGRVDRVRCGPGRDVVEADRVDRVARDCEKVKRLERGARCVAAAEPMDAAAGRRRRRADVEATDRRRVRVSRTTGRV